MRAPVWPEGFVGSITHTSGLAAAAAARVQHTSSLGIDLEGIISAPLVSSLSGSFAQGRELDRVAAEVGDLRIASTALFATKEALFKCLAPLVKRYFEFRDVEAIPVAQGTLEMRLLTDIGRGFPLGRRFVAYFAFSESVVAAAVVLEGVESTSVSKT